MALTVTMGVGSLVSLGMGISDVMTLVSLGNRVGNWMTASSGDDEFLKLLEQDSADILTRRGIIDVPRFNKRWGKSLRLLTNGAPTVMSGASATDLLGNLSRFTATMLCVVAAIEHFASIALARDIMKTLLKRLMRTSERGEDLIDSQFHNRYKAWTSAATVRGLTNECKLLRLQLIGQNSILNGLAPPGEVNAIVDFLYWVLAATTETYTTNSSDVARIAYCLSRIGFDILSVRGLGHAPRGSPCTLLYDTDSQLLNIDGMTPFGKAALRQHCTAVSLLNPEETFSVFPISTATANRCRVAWKGGATAASHAKITLVKPTTKAAAEGQDLLYTVQDLGTEVARSRPAVYALVEAHGLVVNGELCVNLEQVLMREKDSTLEWILDQTTNVRVGPLRTKVRWLGGISDHAHTDKTTIEAFTVFQSFFMGYYYHMFLQLVDTSTLCLQMVDGDWGFRSVDLLGTMRDCCARVSSEGLYREEILSILFISAAWTFRRNPRLWP